jgi:hypothetical protein
MEQLVTLVPAVISVRRWGLALCAAGALLGANSEAAAGSGKPSAAQATYEKDRAACMSGRTSQDRATCLQEASAALQEAKRGSLNDSPSDFERNRLLRCENQPPQDREECVRRMSSEARTSGSVEGGGVLRELTTPDRK